MEMLKFKLFSPHRGRQSSRRQKKAEQTPAQSNIMIMIVIMIVIIITVSNLFSRNPTVLSKSAISEDSCCISATPLLS